MTAPMDAKLCRDALIERDFAQHRGKWLEQGVKLDIADANSFAAGWIARDEAINTRTPAPSPEVDEAEIIKKMLNACDDLEDLEHCMRSALKAIRTCLAPQGASPEVDLLTVSAISSMIGYCQSLKAGTVITQGYIDRMNEYYIPDLHRVKARSNLAPQGAVRVSIPVLLEAYRWNNSTVEKGIKAVILSLKQQNPEVKFDEKD